MGVDVPSQRRSPAGTISVAVRGDFRGGVGTFASGFSSCGRNWGLAAPMFLGIVGELVFGRIAEIEVTRDNRHIEVRE